MPWRPPVHRPPHADPAKLRRDRDQRRGSREDRGYDWVWRRFRAAFLTAHPLCQDCERAGLITSATELHHRLKVADRPDLRLDAENIVPLCRGATRCALGGGREMG